MSSHSNLQLGSGAGLAASQVPTQAQACRQGSDGTVCVLDVLQPDGRRLHWLDAEHARGWIEPCGDAQGEGRFSRFREVFDAATAKGFVGADAALLAVMAADAPQGEAARLPRLSWSESPGFAPVLAPPAREPMGLYALVDSAERLEAVLATGMRTVQLRIKAPKEADAEWQQALRPTMARAIELARDAGAELFINDYWALARDLIAGRSSAGEGATSADRASSGEPTSQPLPSGGSGAARLGVHLGQEDLMALGDAGRAELLASGIALGISSHSIWELCRARALSPRYIACGPVWATTTKDMPWVPQGLDNLAWWCRTAGAPVVAIGGILEPAQVAQTAAAGADAVCVVRGLGEQPAVTVPPLLQAFDEGRAQRTTGGAAEWPHPSLPVRGQ